MHTTASCSPLINADWRADPSVLLGAKHFTKCLKFHIYFLFSKSCHKHLQPIPFFFLALKRSSTNLSLWESSIIWKHTHNGSVWFFYMISTSVEDKGSSFWFLKTRSSLKFESNLLDLSHDLENSKHVQKHCLYHTFLKLIWLILCH